MKHRVFVYGSLKRGGRHHDRMLGAELVREARTLPRYQLYLVGEYPALVEGGSTTVSGELYEVSAALLLALDEFEDVPDHYERGEVVLEDDSVALAYFMTRDAVVGHGTIEGGTFRG